MAFSAFLGVVLGSLAYRMAAITTLVEPTDANLIALAVGSIVSTIAATLLAQATAAQKRAKHANA